MNEGFGILEFQPEALHALDIQPFSTDFTVPDGVIIKHASLSKRQGTRYAVLPVHTRAERALFRTILESLQLNQSPSDRDWITFARRWSSNANGQSIFYKVSPSLVIESNFDVSIACLYSFPNISRRTIRLGMTPATKITRHHRILMGINVSTAF